MQMPGSRRFGRPFCFAIALLLMSVGSYAAAPSGNAPATTEVQDVIYRADGTRATGWLLISWPAFVTADGAAIAAGSKSVQLGSDGSFSASLAPNAGSTPAGSYYAVTLKLEGGTTSKEAWLVPLASPATLAMVRASAVPTTMAVQALTSEWANANLVSRTGTQQIGGVKTFTVPPSAPDPINASDLATKRYVDASGAGPNVAMTNLANLWTAPQSGAFLDKAGAVYNAKAYGAVGDGTTNDTAAINSAMSACYAAGGGSVFIPPTANGYVIKRAISGQQQGGIRLQAGCSLIGSNTKLILQDNASFIYGDSSQASVLLTNVAADVAVGDTNLTVLTSAGFAVGQDVFFRLVQNPADAPEVQYFGWAKVVAVPDGTHVTLDRPMEQAMSYASTPAANRTLETFPSGVIQDIEVKGFQLVQGANGNSEEGIYLVFARNVNISGITCVDPGAGCVTGQYVENTDVSNVRVPHSVRQLGQASKGRVIACAECSNVTFENIEGAHFDGAFAFIESYSKNINLRNVLVVDDSSTRAATSFFTVVGNSQVSMQDVRIEGNGANLLDDGGSGMFPDIENLTVNAGSGMTITPAALGVVRGRLSLNSGFRLGANYGPFNFTRTKTWSTTVYPIASTPNQNFAIPVGLYKSVRAFVSNSTGLTSMYLTNTGTHNTNNLVSLMTASGSTLAGDISGQASGLSGTGSYAFNSYDIYGRNLTVYTDASWVPGSYITLEIEYWPFLGAGNHDQSFQLLQPTNAGYTGTTTVGSCVMTIQGGAITGITGC